MAMKNLIRIAAVMGGLMLVGLAVSAAEPIRIGGLFDLSGKAQHIGTPTKDTLSATDHCGLGVDSLVMLKVENGKWKLEK